MVGVVNSFKGCQTVRSEQKAEEHQSTTSELRRDKTLPSSKVKAIGVKT